jgi:transcriptional regulator with XRE-family HTH domain
VSAKERTLGGAERGGSGPTLAERLLAHRRSLGISQARAARDLDVARTAYRLWELGAARPALDRWNTLARWLGISMTTLLAGEGLLPAQEEEHRPGDFFQEAERYLDRSLREGLVAPSEASQFREMFDRIRRGLQVDGAGQSVGAGPSRPGVDSTT